MPEAYDFTGLTLLQQEVLTFQGWCATDAGRRLQPQPRTVAKLIARGLVTQREVDYGRLIVMEYEVPIPVHAAWCAYCALKRKVA